MSEYSVRLIVHAAKQISIKGACIAHTLCSSIPANMAEEEVAELLVGNGSGMCKAGFCW